MAIELMPCTNDSWHEFYRNYVADPMMEPTPFVYDFNRCEEAFRKKMPDATRQYFSIICESKVVGEIYLKHINMERKTAEFGIALINDSVKGKGYGTEAITLLIDYVFKILLLDELTATSVLRNVRSQHILEKVGFVYSHEDYKFKHYVLSKKCAMKN